MYRDNELLRLAKGERCLLEVHPYCQGDLGETTVACHSNQIIHGKGKGIKADDSMTVWGCVRCHTWLDQGPMTKKEKEKLFDNAWKEQLVEWSKIAANPLLRPNRKEAAERVLKHLGQIK